MSIDRYLSKRPLDVADLAATAAALGLGPRAAVRELTREQKAEQEARLAPYMRRAVRS